MNEELRIIISAEIEKLKKELANAKKETENFSKKGKEGFSKFNDSVQKANEVSSKAFKAIAISVAGAATALLALGAKSEEYRVSQAQLATAFETAGGSAEQAKVVYEDLYRVLGDNGQATEAAQHLAQLTTNEQELAEWTDICQGVYATFGASLPIESLTEAANETAKTGELTGALTDALNWAGIAEDDFRAKLLECNTEAEREALIRSTLSGLYSEAAAGYENNAAAILAQHEAEVKLNEAMAALGEAVAPIQTMLAEFAAQMLTELSPAVQEFAEEHGPKLKKILTQVAEAIGKVIGWLADNWDIIADLAPIVLGVVAAIKAFSVVMGIVNAVMAASPVTWIVLGIVAAIAALVAIVVVIIKYWDEIKGAAAKAWEGIKNIWSKVANWFDKNVVQPIANFFSGLWNSIKNIFSSVGNWFKNIFSQAWSGIKSAFSSVGDFFGGIWNSIKKIFSNVGATIGNAITNTVKKAVNGVLSTAVKIINGFISAINFAIGVINLIPGVNIGKITPLAVPKLAKGGVIDSATLAVVGEQGREVVMPLENNTEWMDILANRIAGVLGEGGNRPIVLQVDGKTFAQIAIKSINNLTRQQGKLSLNLV